MTKLIAAIDNSVTARPVCAMALAVAPVLGADIECVHVVEDGFQTAQAVAEASGLPLRLLKDDSLDALARVAVEPDVVAVLLGAHSHPGTRRGVGHLPLALASETDNPVIVVPPTAHPPARVSRVLIAMKGTPTKPVDLRRAIELATASGLDITVVHVDDESTIPPFCDQVQHDTDVYAAEFFARNLPGAIHARLELRVGSPVEEILDVARSVGAEILAVGWPRHTGPGHGEVAREILERSETPVLLVGTR